MAPEQMSGKQGDARSDLFSLGVVLYSMITGFRPFQGNSAKTVVFKVMNIEPVPVTSFQTEVSPELDAIVSRAIAKDPEERYQSAAALAAAIREFRNSGFMLSASTTFITPSLHNELPRAIDKNRKAAKPFMRYSLPAAVLLVALASLFLGWRLENSRNIPLPAELIAELRFRPIRSHPLATARAVLEEVAPRRTRVRVKSAQELSLRSARKPIEPAKVQLEIQHHFNAAKASLWLDNKLILEQDLRGGDQRRLLIRSVEIRQLTNFQFAPGKHSLQLRIVSARNKYDRIETLQADLAPGSEHVLYVNCSKRKMQVALQ
jgi:serine/threonine protein kinase